MKLLKHKTFNIYLDVDDKIVFSNSFNITDRIVLNSNDWDLVLENQVVKNDTTQDYKLVGLKYKDLIYLKEDNIFKLKIPFLFWNVTVSTIRNVDFLINPQYTPIYIKI